MFNLGKNVFSGGHFFKVQMASNNNNDDIGIAQNGNLRTILFVQLNA